MLLSRPTTWFSTYMLRQILPISCSIYNRPSVCLFFFILITTSMIGVLAAFSSSSSLILILNTSRFCFSSEDGGANSTQKSLRRTKITTTCAHHGPKERIQEMFKKVELSVSAYDTAWVAMVPSPASPHQPCFPECLSWILENQLHDGSWSVPHHPNLLIKDSMLSTLACVLALRRWEIGEEQIRKGLDFMGSNYGALMDKKQASLVGFDIIFPSMTEHARYLGLNLPLSSDFVHNMLHRRDLEYDRLLGCNSNESKKYVAYTSEGLTQTYDRREISKYKMKNGSILNSPSTTASFFIQHRDVECLEYLQSLIQVFGDAVPTIHPLNMYIHLRMIDRLEKLGTRRHFQKEIKEVLDNTYRCWLQGDEEIFLDIETRALAFRLLRTNDYEVSPEALSDVNKEEYFFRSTRRNHKILYTVLELYRASEIMISPDEEVLETLHTWTTSLLQEELSCGSINDEACRREVDHALKYPYKVNMERLEHRKSIQFYRTDNSRILKAAYRCSNIDNKDLLHLAVEDYNFCQAIYQKELITLERWVKENGLDQLKFARQKLTYIHFSAACVLFSPELSEARLAWTKTVFLATIIDDFYDVEGSREELVDLIELFEKWEGNSGSDYYSDKVKIIFLAIHKNINDLGTTAFARQGRDITRHLIELWIDLLKSELQEFDWVRDKSTPTIEDYIKTASVSFALCCVVLIPLYFIGPTITEEMITSLEYNNLLKHMSICCRLVNDTRTYKREAEQGKLNSVMLHQIHGHGNVSEQEALTLVKNTINQNRKDLLSLVLRKEGSIVPKACKEVFFSTEKINALFYAKGDGFSSPLEMMNAANKVLHEPIHLQSTTLSSG